MDKNNQYNSVFISDVHLGFLGCKAEKLYEFLNKLNCKKLFLVGDIIDFWAMKDNFYWPKEHQKVLDKLANKKVLPKNAVARQKSRLSKSIKNLG